MAVGSKGRSGVRGAVSSSPPIAPEHVNLTTRLGVQMYLSSSFIAKRG